MKKQFDRQKEAHLTRVRVFQICGIALLTLSILNAMFLENIGMSVNIALALASAFFLLLSFRLWNRCRRLYRLR